MALYIVSRITLKNKRLKKIYIYTLVYILIHIMSIEGIFSLLTRLLSEDFITRHSPRGAAHAASATSFLYKDGATVTFNYL